MHLGKRLRAMFEAMAPRARGSAAARARAPPDVQPVAVQPVAAQPVAVQPVAVQAVVVPARRYECASCMDDMDPSTTRFLTAPCDHTYCATCVVVLFTQSLTDETLFPPRCCNQAIPLEESRVFLEVELQDRFWAKKLEFDNPNPTRCHQSKCAALIPPVFVRNDVGSCALCQEQTCAICKKSAHPGDDCPEDRATQELLKLAQEAKWQRCPSCRRLVEIIGGCNLIKCRCKASFCYVCGTQWGIMGSCDCPSWRVRANAAARAAEMSRAERFRIAMRDRWRRLPSWAV